MNILLHWKISDIEEKHLREGLSGHNLTITSDVNSENILGTDELKKADILIAGNANKEMIAEAKNLKLIQSMISGTSHIAFDSAYKRGIPVCSSKGGNAISVREHAMMLMLNLSKNYNKYINDVQSGIWEKTYSDSLYGKNLGIIGLGCVGTEVARIGLAFDMNISSVRMRPHLGTNGLDIPKPNPSEDINKVIENSDYLIVSVPKTDKTFNLIAENEIRSMKKGSRIINLSRGITVNQEAVYSALMNEHLAGFATDVFPFEPYDFKHPIYTLENVVATPHVGAFNEESKIRCLDNTILNINRFIDGKVLLKEVNNDLKY